MVKICKVLLNNEAVTVVKYDDVDVQLPSIHKNCSEIAVEHDNGTYWAVDENEKKTAKEKKATSDEK